MPELVFLKLGGSLITDKIQVRTVRGDVLVRLAQEVKDALDSSPEMRVVLGHGSGSFGHIPAHQYQTRQGVRTPQEWVGFAEVWKEANALNRLVMDALSRVSLPAVSLPASAAITARDGEVIEWNLNPLKMALQAGLLPVVYGDVIFDTVRGGTILSTEDLFAHLARFLQPKRILLAGVEAGVWADFPHKTQLIKQITPDNYSQISSALGGSIATDVTGGMASKVDEMLALVQQNPALSIRIFSGEQPGAVKDTLLGAALGTVICALTSPTT